MKKDQMQREIDARDFLIKSREGEVQKLRAISDTDKARVEATMYYLIAVMLKMGESVIEITKQELIDSAKAGITFEITEEGNYRFVLGKEEINE